MTQAIADEYELSLLAGDFERPEELPIDFESVNDRLWAEKEAEGRGNRADFEREKEEKAEAERERLAPKAKGKVKGSKVAKREV